MREYISQHGTNYAPDTMATFSFEISLNMYNHSLYVLGCKYANKKPTFNQSPHMINKSATNPRQRNDNGVHKKQPRPLEGLPNKHLRKQSNHKGANKPSKS